MLYRDISTVPLLEPSMILIFKLLTDHTIHTYQDSLFLQVDGRVVMEQSKTRPKECGSLPMKSYERMLGPNV